jgi:hypothetical protein
LTDLQAEYKNEFNSLKESYENIDELRNFSKYRNSPKNKNILKHQDIFSRIDDLKV